MSQYNGNCNKDGQLSDGWCSISADLILGS